jgi:uncharacterized protein
MWQFAAMLDEKLARLTAELKGYSSCLVAYSGGVDSALLALLAHQVLGKNAHLVIADSPSLPREELSDAVALAERFAFPLEVVTTAEFANESYTSNPVNRCYFCKHELFTQMEKLATERGVNVLIYGENASDIGDHRPGAQAATEFEVKAPLKEIGLTKTEIRELSRRFGLPTADKPQMACLSSRIPYGEPVTPGKLRMVEEAEAFLRELGARDVRVRHHELKTGDMARIEIAPSEFGLLAEESTCTQIDSRLRKIGYAVVTLDLQGYRRGSLNAAVESAAP